MAQLAREAEEAYQLLKQEISVDAAGEDRRTESQTEALMTEMAEYITVRDIDYHFPFVN